QGGDGRFARVVIPSPLKDPLIYKIPASFQGDLRIGMRVQVPLGRQKVTGVVSEFLSESPLIQVKEISNLLDERPILDSSLLELTRWISQYYLAPLGEVLGTVL
ncbi:MAG: primosomal protein N', partial [Candidatus Latescibacteria bacterium]|nr:primosomal protein N' [Candidatus Latescibacterota bacterium]